MNGTAKYLLFRRGERVSAHLVPEARHQLTDDQSREETRRQTLGEHKVDLQEEIKPECWMRVDKTTEWMGIFKCGCR